ncbi:MAG: beta-lactamase family protein [Polyangiaceae bacterium]|nr:beta-lactamase family protein [Polyangiaceae bacterium]MCW5792331.1 beta-lactamase family protein [Polyangiaceae bacterium]
MKRRTERLGWLVLGAWALGGCQAAPRGEPQRAPAPLTSSAPAPSPSLASDAGPGAGDAAPDAQPAPRAARPVDRARLQALVARARSLGTDQLVIWQGGEELAAIDARGAPIQTMSITKSVLALAALRLVEAGRLKLEAPVSAHFPEWRAGDKGAVLVSHLLTHTSGLKEPPATSAIYQQRDFVRFALDSELTARPGERFVYGNSASNLLAGVVAQAASQRADRYVAAQLFKPLGITRWWWSLDRANNAHGLAGLHMNADGLLRLGQLVLGLGRAPDESGALSEAGERLISEPLVTRALTSLSHPQPPHKRAAWLWWAVPEWTQVWLTRATLAAWGRAGAPSALVERSKALENERFPSVEALRVALLAFRPDGVEERAWRADVWRAGLPEAAYRFGPQVGSYAAGSLGQYLVVLPQDALIAVRLRRAPQVRQAGDPADFPDFIEAVQALVSEAPAP